MLSSDAQRDYINGLIGRLNSNEPDKFLQWEKGWRTYYPGFDLTAFALSIAAEVAGSTMDAGSAEEVARLRALISRPYVGAWLDEILIEAAHQRERWGADQDTGKAAPDWFWLVGYLAGKALASHLAGDLVKAHHHTVSTAAVLAHWAAAIGGHENVMRPGVGAAKLAGVA